MQYETHKEIFCIDTRKTFRIGDVVTVHTKDGGGFGGGRIVKITDNGFHYNQGIGRDKCIQYEKIEEID